MAFFKIENVAIRGIAACVPKKIEENVGLDFISSEEIDNVIKATGIKRRHIAEEGTTCSDLCTQAFSKLLEELEWEKDSIDALAYLSVVHDYVQPNTACILQGKLGLKEECYALDLNQGCPGYIVGLSTLASLVSHGDIKRAVFLNGDINTSHFSPYDKEMRPLFSDAGAATFIEYDENAEPMYFHIATKGADWQAIYTPAGGLRHPISKESFTFKESEDGSIRRDIDNRMDGMSVFAFGLSSVPKTLKKLWNHFDIDKDSVDKYLFHQANMFMNEKIRKKLKIDAEKVPYILEDYGNTASASIPLTIVVSSNGEYEQKKLKNIGCAFGVGLQYGSFYFVTNNIKCPKLIEY